MSCTLLFFYNDWLSQCILCQLFPLKCWKPDKNGMLLINNGFSKLIKLSSVFHYYSMCNDLTFCHNRCLKQRFQRWFPDHWYWWESISLHWDDHIQIFAYTKICLFNRMKLRNKPTASCYWLIHESGSNRQFYIHCIRVFHWYVGHLPVAWNHLVKWEAEGHLIYRGYNPPTDTTLVQTSAREKAPLLYCMLMASGMCVGFHLLLIP